MRKVDFGKVFSRQRPPEYKRKNYLLLFFKDDFDDQKSAIDTICVILRQLFLAKPHLLRDSIFERLDINRDEFI